MTAIRLARRLLVILGGILAVAGAFGIRTIRRPPPATSRGELPTDLAAPAQASRVRFDEAPQTRGSVSPIDQRSALPIVRVPPRLMPDPQHPPQWNRPIAVPERPAPPDPWARPPMVVDPERGRHSVP